MAGKISYDSHDKRYGLAIPGTANSGMSASTTTIVAAELAGFGNDFFNTHYFMQIIKDDDGAGSAPEGEIRQVTDYVSSSGTFTTDAFSANVEEADEFLLLHNSVVSLLSQETIMGYFALADRDDFDVSDPDADTQRWNTEYISGAAGGSADIDTTTSGKLYILADKDAGAERYAVSRNLEMFADFMTITEDVNVTFGTTDGAAAKAVGIGVSAGAAYDSRNYIFIERQKGTGVNRIQVRSNLNNAGEVTENVGITDDVLAFKIERWDQVWRVYYSSTQDPNYDWILASRIEDPSNYMTNAYTFYQEAFNGSAGNANETAQGDFDNFRYYVGASGGGQYIVGDYDSTHISNDVDGDVMERQEAIQKALQIVAGGATGFEADGTGYTLYKAIRNIMAQWGSSGNVFTCAPGASDDTADGLSLDTPKKWTNSAIDLCTSGAGDVILRLPGDENIDDDDSDPPLVCDVSGLTIIGMGGGNPGQKGEINSSIRRRFDSGWAAASGPCVIIDKATSLIDLEIVASGQPGVLFTGEGGGEEGGFSHLLRLRFVGWGLMTQGVYFDAGAYNKVEACNFESLTSGVVFSSTASNNPDYNEIIHSHFAGCTYGINYYGSPNIHNTRVSWNHFYSTETGTMTNGIRTGGLWDSGEISFNTFDCDREDAYAETVESIRAGGVKVFGNTYKNGTDEELDRAQNLSFRGRVSAEESGSETTGFYIDALTGFGNDYFNTEYSVQVIKSTDGAAPVGETRDISDYVSNDGHFIVGTAFSANINTGDDVTVIHKSQLGLSVVGRGTLTTSSATVPADTSRTEGNDYWNGCLLMPLTGACAFQPRRIVDYAATGDIFTIDPSNPFTAATGQVGYVILADQTDFVAGVDNSAQRTPSDVFGNPGDTIPDMDAVMSTSDSLFDVVNAIKERLGATPADSDDPLHLIHGQRDDAADFTYNATTGIVPLIKGILGSRVIAEGTLDTGSATVPADSSTAGSKGNDYYNGCLLVPLTGDVAFQPRRIVDFATTTGIFTIDPNAPFSAATGTVAYLILAAQDSNYPDLLHLLVATADGGSNVYPDSVVQESILAFIMSKSANPVTTSYDNTTDSLEAISDKLATGAGNLQMAATTIDLQQAADSYDLFTGTTQAVVVERLIFRLPDVNVSDDSGAFTSISIQTDDTTASIFLSSAAGAKANLTAEAQLGANINNGILIKIGTKIRLTIAGGAADAATVCDVIAAYRSVVSGGTLA